MTNLNIIMQKAERNHEGRSPFTCVIYMLHGRKVKAQVTHLFQKKVHVQSWETAASA